jgi:hypothetical protein
MQHAANDVAAAAAGVAAALPYRSWPILLIADPQ